YDPNSNRLTLTDPLNQLTTFGYDAVNRLTGITYTNPAPGTSATANVSYVYDANGNRLSMGDGTGSTTYVYDELDRLLSVTSLNTGTVGYRFDLDGNRTKLIYPDNTAVTYSFNKASQLQSLLDWASRTTSYSYFADGLLNITTNPNGTSAQFSYDNARRLTDVWNQEGTSTISRHTYTLDAVGNRTQLTEVLPQLGAPGPSAGMPLEMANAGGPPVADQLPSAGAVDPGDTMLSAASVASGPLAQAPPPASGPSTTPTSVPSATSTKVTTTPTAVVPASIATTGAAPSPTRTTATPPSTLTATPSASAAGAAATPTSSKPTAARDVQNGPPPDLLDLSRPLTLTRRPNGDQLQVLLRPSGFQVVPIDAATYSLRDSHGTEQLRLRAAAILDGLGATGQTSVTVSSDQKTATLHFDPAFLAGATYPLTISPVVIRAQPGHPTPVANAAADQATGGEDELAIASVSNANGWGANWYGEVGDGTSTQRSTPNSVVNLTNQVAISAGGYHSLALSNDGRVWTWGANWDGELGRATTTTCWDGSQNAPCDPNPQSIPSFNGVVAIAGGGYHSLALKNDGTVWAWGGNWDGELGDGTTTNQSIPVQVQGLSGVTAIAAGRYFSLALKSDGTVWAWGDNESGQLGNGTNTNSLTPVQVQSLADVTQLKAGAYFGLALDGTGGLWSWGDNAYGQLGLGSNGNGVNLPSHITTLSSVVLLSAGGYHGLAEKSDGTLWSWGADWDGELAYTASQTCVYNGSNNPCSMTPAQVPGLSGLSQLAGADWHSLALKDDGTVWAWGGNWQGELGDGTTTGSTTPVQSTGLTGQTLVAAGREHSLSGVADRVATTTYTYDKLYRLTGVANPADTTTYSYDPLGNRTSKVLGSSTTNYSYDRSDRITAASSTSYTVNANGNETARGSDNFTYDQANRLTSATVGGATSTYVYDGDGKRVSKTVGGITTRYVYDVGGGLPVVLDDGTNKYVWGAGGLATAVNKTSGAASVYHTDGLGSVRALTDNSGSVVQTYQTDEFGIPTQSQGGVSQSFGYTGEPRDSEDGLQYLRARTYDSGIGRFLQRDRRYGTLKDSQSLNGYSYVRNNPLRFTDRTGLTPSESGDACPDCVSEVGLLNGSPLDYAFLIVSAVVPGGPGDDIVVADAADAAEGAVTSLAKWEPDFAAKQILGGSNITAGGRTITWHAADRIVTSGRGIAVADIDPILDNAIRLTYNPLARGGATIRLFDVLGRSVVVDAETGLRIVTVIP
ncbi:MAG: hypothetical protein JO020_16765, partial [Chloroflexi bacterium]|nr:hypothetical protein [Chloroflexota bacterium]